MLERRSAKTGWKLKFLLVLLFAAMGYVLYDFTRFVSVCNHFARLANRSSYLLPARVIPEEAIVVLTGDQHRIPKALELLRGRGTPLLIISGTGKGATLTDVVNQQGHSVQNIHAVWRKILIEPRSGSTIENAEESGGLLLQHKIQRVVLVTSDYHMLRALRIFKTVLPRMEILAFPVASPVAEWSAISLARQTNKSGSVHVDPGLSVRSTIEGFMKIWFEYWKYFAFRVYASHYLRPLQK